jgi:Ohr subfamily peroxiredoxin
MTTLRPPPLTLFDKYSGHEPQILYSTTVTVTGGNAEHGRASGVARSDDGQFTAALRLPKALGGPGGGTNPEQLFAAGYAACFHGALNLLAARSAVPISGSAVDVTVDFGRDPMDGLFVLSAHTRVHLPGVDRTVAEELVRKTERFCPYTKMARQGIVNVVALVVPGEASES